MALLLADTENDELSLARNETKMDESPYFICPIAFIQPNPYQPRKVFNPEELESLGPLFPGFECERHLLVAERGFGQDHMICRLFCQLEFRVADPASGRGPGSP